MDGTMQLESFLAVIPDHRRPQGRRYSLGYLLLFTLLALLSGATSYRAIERFIEARREQLNGLCGLRWKRAPAYHSIRYALQGLEIAKVKAALQTPAAVPASLSPGGVGIALDSQVLRRGLEHFQDRQAKRVLSVLATANPLVLGQVVLDAGEAVHGTMAVQQWLEEWGLSGKVSLLQARSGREGDSAPPAEV
jgi:hypothetical protein